MLKNITEIKEIINEREYISLCDSDSPLSDLKEFAFRLLKVCGNIEDQAKASQEQEKINNDSLQKNKELAEIQQPDSEK